MNDLHAQLDSASAYDAEYGHNLANHLPMTLTALQRLGASAQQRDGFTQRYAQAHQLHAAPPIQAWPAGEPWRERLGDPAAWPAYRGLFREWIGHEGEHGVLAQVLPWLMPGVGAAAFHGLLRVSYALAASHSSEVADGLAYWACRWFDCGAAAVGASAQDPAELVTGLHIRTAPRNLIAERMALVVATPAFRTAMKRWTVNATDTVPAIARLAAEHYAASGHFTLLHVLTSAQAMHVLLPWLDERDRDQAVACYAAAGAAAWISATPRPAMPSEALHWSQIVECVLGGAKRDDEHAVKCVDAAREWDRIEPHPRWLAAATRAVQ
jgi:hypothetical protein